jgi:kynurenine formamidase
VTTVPEHGFYLQYVQQGEHTGTHWGAPAHFDDDQPYVDELDAVDLFLRAVKIDMRERAARDARRRPRSDSTEEWAPDAERRSVDRSFPYPAREKIYDR